MPFFRRIVGLVLVALGAVGLIAALVGVGLLWTYGSKAATRAEGVIDKLAATVVRLDEITGRTLRYVEAGEQATVSLNAAVQLRAALPPPEVAQPSRDFDELERKVITGVRYARDELHLASDAGQLVQQLLELAGEADADDSLRGAVGRLVEKIEQGRAAVAQASQALDAIQASLAEIRREQNMRRNAEVVSRNSRIIGEKLAEVRGQVVRIKQELERTQGWLETIRDNSKTWILTGQVTLTLLAVWLGAGQLCMAVVGARMLKARPA